MNSSYLYVVIAGILSGGIVSGGAFLASLGLSLYQIAVFPFIFSLIFLGPFIVYKRDFLQKKGELLHFAVFGLIGLPLVLSEFGPVVLGIPVALSVLLLYTQPIWNVILSRLYLREKITKTKIAALGCAISGLLVMVNPFNIHQVGNPWGIALGLFGGITFAGWIIFGRISGEKDIRPATTQFYQAFFVFIFLLLAYPLILIFVKDPKLVDLSLNIPWTIWVYLAFYELPFFIIAHLFLFEGQKRVSASTSGVILLIEPVAAALIAAVFLKQPITTGIFIGGIFILLANYLVIKEETKSSSRSKT
jgi:drug/metabolite transporter (DMT)-like permease